MINQKSFKKTVALVSFIALIGNATPLFAQLVELEVLGGGYKLRGPTEIAFPTLSTTTSPRTNTVDFSTIGDSTPSQADNNYLMIIDENGGNPFDVTVTSSELKRNDRQHTTTIPGSTDTEIKVTSSIGFSMGDTFVMPTYNSSPETHYQIESVPDDTTFILTAALPDGAPGAGLDINQVVDCSLSPKKCIPLSSFSIINGDTIETMYGNAGDLALNSDTADFRPFKGRSTTLAGSNNTTLYVADSSQFYVDESITFPAGSGITPLTNTISSISDSTTIVLSTPLTNPPAADIAVQSTDARNLTLGNGNGAAPGQWKIYPQLQTIIDAGQLPGTYEAILNFTIV